MTQTKECLCCGNSFSPYRSNALYCGKKCKARINYLKAQALGKPAKWQYKHYVKRVYGLTVEEIEAMSEAQNHSCKICLTHISAFTGQKKKLCVDHCHATGKVRGLLCETCNSMLGMAKDNPTILRNAIDYLEVNIQL